MLTYPTLMCDREGAPRRFRFVRREPIGGRLAGSCSLIFSCETCGHHRIWGNETSASGATPAARREDA